MRMNMRTPTNPVNIDKPDTFGSSRFMTLNEADFNRLLIKGEDDKLCPYVGGLTKGPGISDQAWPIYARSTSECHYATSTELLGGSGHLLTVAPTRAGKGRGQIIPNLLSWQGSCFILDVKGENYLKSAGYREKVLGQKVVKFSPFEDESDIWNPIMSISSNPEEEEEDVRYLANQLVTVGGEGENEIFIQNARSFIEGLLLHVRTAELHHKTPKYVAKVQERSMGEVHRLLNLSIARPPRDPNADPSEPTKKSHFDLMLQGMAKSKKHQIANAGKQMQGLMNGEGRTGKSVLFYAKEYLSCWGYSRIKRCTYKPSDDPNDLEPGPDDYCFEDLRKNDPNLSIYIIVPPDYLTEYRSILRVFVGMVTRKLRMAINKEVRKSAPVLMILDEFPQLAYMKSIEEGLLYLAGYGVRMWFFVQDLSQLQLHYPQTWRTFMANTGTQSFFGVSDIHTAKLVSEMAGKLTVQNRTFGASITDQDSKGASQSHGKSDTTGWNSSSSTNSHTYSENWQSSISRGQSDQSSYVGRDLIMPDEVLRMHDQEQLIFMKGMRPILATNVPYYKIDVLNERSNISPPKPVSFL